MSCSGVPSGWALRHAEISSRALVRSSGFSSRNLTARDSMAAGCVKVQSAEPMSRGPDDALVFLDSYNLARYQLNKQLATLPEIQAQYLGDRVRKLTTGFEAEFQVGSLGQTSVTNDEVINELLDRKSDRHLVSYFPVCSFAFFSAGPITLSVIAASSRSWSSYRYGSNTHGYRLKCSNIPYSLCDANRSGWTGTDGSVGTIAINSCGMPLASVMSAITNCAMCASVETVSVMSRLDGFSKSKRTGR